MQVTLSLKSKPGNACGVNEPKVAGAEVQSTELLKVLSHLCQRFPNLPSDTAIAALVALNQRKWISECGAWQVPLVAFGDRAEVWAALVLFIYKHNTLQSGTWNPNHGWFQVPAGLQCVALSPEPREHGWSVLVLCEVTGPCLHSTGGFGNGRIPKQGSPGTAPVWGAALSPSVGVLGC